MRDERACHRHIADRRRSHDARRAGAVDGGVEDAASCPTLPFPVTIGEGSPFFVVSFLGDEDAPVAPETDCEVHADGATYEVDAAIAIASTAAFSISGQMSIGTSGRSVTTNGLRVTFMLGGITYASEACTVEFDPATMGIRRGALWVDLTCPPVSDGQGHSCVATAELVFNGCRP